VQDLANFLPLVLIVLVFWLLIVRPQRRRQQALATTQASLGLGSEVMLGSGIFGRVASLDDETVQLEVAPGTVVKVSRQAIVRVLDDGVEPGPAAQDPTEHIEAEDDVHGVQDRDDRHQ
jgi:preprotein translocase subunit YajC